MANPNPKTDHLKPYRYTSDRKPGTKVIGTRYPLEVEQALLILSNHQQYIKEVVEAALRRDGLMQPPDDHQ